MRYHLRRKLVHRKEMWSLDGYESLGRDITSESRAKRAAKTGVISHDIFGPVRSNKISVDRLDQDNRVEMAQLARKRAKNIPGGKEFYGWAVLKVEEVTSEGTRKVIASPQPSNPYHADIVLLDLPDNSDDLKKTLKKHFNELADLAKWEVAPDIT